MDVVDDETGLCWAARILARAGGGAGSGSMSPHPSFSSSSTARVWSCASPQPSVDVGDATAASSACRRELAFAYVATGCRGRISGTEAAFAIQHVSDLTSGRSCEEIKHKTKLHQEASSFKDDLTSIL